MASGERSNVNCAGACRADPGGRRGVRPAVECDHGYRDRTFDLASVHRALESWRRIAWLTQANGPDGYRRMLARAECTLRTGELPPDSVPLDQIKALIAERWG